MPRKDEKTNKQTKAIVLLLTTLSPLPMQSLNVNMFEEIVHPGVRGVSNTQDNLKVEHKETAK